MISVHGHPEFITGGVMYGGTGLHKRCGSKETSCGHQEPQGSGGRSEKDEPKLSLMEELLLVVMDPRGFVSIWNDHVSRALRGSILIELWLRGRLELEPAGMRRKCLSRRAVVVKSTSPTDDCMLNEALKLINDGSTHTVSDWISYLAGETWNPLKLKYHMRLVRDRIFKDLVERRILTTEKTNYWLVDIKTHPIKDLSVQKKLFSKIKDALLENYCNDVHRVDKRILSLLMLTQYSGGIDECLAGLPNDLLRLAMKRIQDLESTDFEVESRKGAPNDLHWAVFAALNDPFVVL